KFIYFQTLTYSPAGWSFGKGENVFNSGFAGLELGATVRKSSTFPHIPLQSRGNLMHWSLVYLISEWSIRLVMLFYVPQRRSAAATRTWLLLIFLLPWPGLILYAIFGRIRMPKVRVEQQSRASRKIRAVQAQMGVRKLARPHISAHLTPIVTLATRL